MYGSCNGMEKWNLFLAFLLDSNTTDHLVDLTRASTMMGKRLGTH